MRRSSLPFPRVGGGIAPRQRGRGRGGLPGLPRPGAGPTLLPSDVVVPDNLSGHKVDGLEQVVKKYGARLLHRPPYSPDFNPIEWAFSNLKTRRCKAQARTHNVRKEAICTAAEWISEHDAENWFDHCSNHVH